MSTIDFAKYRSLASLHEWRDNYNSNDVARIARSIRRFGFNNALRVWRDEIVMAGNHTLKALRLIKSEGPKEELDHRYPPHNIMVEDDEWYVPIIDVSHLDEVEARAFAIADNQLARMSVVDERLLTQYLKEINEADPGMFGATGFEKRTLNRMVAQFLEAASKANDPGAQLDRGEELRQQWGVEPGQLWVIPSKSAKGEHRLLCGDSTSIDAVQRLMDGKRAALFATDPPYLVAYDGTNHPHKWNEEDKNKDWSATYQDWDAPEGGELLYDGFVRAAKAAAITEDAAWYCWHASRNQAMLEEIWKKHGAFVHQQIIWVKDRPVLTRSWYMWQHEPCFFGWIQGKKPKRAMDNHPSNVWNVPTITPGTSTDHPTSKPIDLFRIPMEQHTEPGDICYEPFSGSGSQHVAGEQCGRLVYGLELQPVYCAVILERLKGMGLSPSLHS